MIIYRTRGKSNTAGKAGVIFYALPADAERYFKRIAGDILAKADCAVYYDTEISDPRRFLDSVGYAKLLVMVVTQAFLDDTEGFSGEVFREAFKHRVPVLPILDDKSLANEFNEKVGSIQFLLLDDEDKTALGYEKKLEDFLDSIFISDDVSEKIRKMFDAKIFLSYRKKDRAYALELMKLIHNVPRAQGVRIWYDEFLSIGRDFNENIDNELKNCDLFALTVTPNTLAKGNYVLDTEIPNARKYERNIMAVEMKDVDRAQLEQSIINSADVIRRDEKERLYGAVTEALGSFFRDHRDDPEYLYYMGLAYLNGVGVEIDGERAEKLLISSMEGGFPEAAGKLSDMYFLGNGVEQSYETALGYMERCTLLWKKRSESSGDEGDTESYFKAMDKYADRVRELKDHQKAIDIYSEMESALQDTFSGDREQLFQNMLLMTRRRIGVQYYDMGMTEKARECFEDVVNNNPVSTVTALPISGCCFNLGRIALRSSDHDTALKYFTMAKDICEEYMVPILPEAAVMTVTIFKAYIARAYSGMGETEKALKIIREVLEEYTEISVLYGSNEYIRNKVRFLTDAGQYEIALGNNENAVRDCLSAMEMLDKLDEKAALPEDIHLRCATAFNLFEIYKNSAPAEAEKWLDMCLEKEEYLSEKYGDEQFVKTYAAAANRKGQIMMGKNDRRNALRYFRLSLKYANKMEGDLRTRQDLLSTDLIAIAGCLLYFGEIETAAMTVFMYCKCSWEYYETAPDAEKYAEAVKAYLYAYFMWSRIDDDKEPDKMLTEAEELYAKYDKEAPFSAGHKEMFSYSCRTAYRLLGEEKKSAMEKGDVRTAKRAASCIADLHNCICSLFGKDADEAQGYEEENSVITAEMKIKAAENNVRRHGGEPGRVPDIRSKECAEAYLELARTARGCGKYEYAAKRFFELANAYLFTKKSDDTSEKMHIEALECCKPGMQQDGELKPLRQLYAAILDSLTDHLTERGEYDKAMKYAGELLEISKENVQRYKEPFDLITLCNAHDHFGRLLLKSGSCSEAVKYLNKAAYDGNELLKLFGQSEEMTMNISVYQRRRYHDLGDAYKQLGNVEEAAESYLRCLLFGRILYKGRPTPENARCVADSTAEAVSLMPRSQMREELLIIGLELCRDMLSKNKDVEYFEAAIKRLEGLYGE